MMKMMMMMMTMRKRNKMMMNSKAKNHGIVLVWEKNEKKVIVKIIMK